MQEIIQPCKICGKPAVAQFEDESPQEAVDKWLPLLTHNRCSDIRRKRIDSSEKIITACFNYVRTPEKEKPKMFCTFKDTVTIFTKRFSEAIRDQHHQERVMWSEDFVQLFIDRPELAARILSNYHRDFQQQADVQQPSLPHND